MSSRSVAFGLIAIAVLLPALAFSGYALAKGKGISALEYWPIGPRAKTRGLLVVIHGCLQSAEAMAMGTGLNRVAHRLGWATLYPQVPDGHPLGCWSWYEPINQHLKAEHSQLAGLKVLIERTRSAHSLESKPVVVVGMSSGAGVAAALSACWPKHIKGTVLHSGPAYASAQSADDAVRVLESGPQGDLSNAPCDTKLQTGHLLIIHGDADRTVHPKHAETQSALFSSARIQLHIIKGLGHAWSGSPSHWPFPNLLGPTASQNPTRLPFFAEGGPSSTDLIDRWLAKSF